MPSNVKHKKVSSKADDPDADLIRPSNWNEEHLGAVEVLDRDTVQVQVENTVTETSVYSHLVPANQLGVDGGFEALIAGSLLVNVAGNLTIRIKFGGVTILPGGPADLADDSTRAEFALRFTMLNLTTGTQKWSVEFVALPGTGDFPIVSGASGLKHHHGVGQASSSVDTTTAQTLDVTVEWSVASANLSWRKELALLKEIPKS